MLLPPSVAKNRKVSLDVRNIPFLVALRYACQQAGTDFTVETCAIAITDRAKAEPNDGDMRAANGAITYLGIPRIALDQSPLGVALDLLKQDVRNMSAGALDVNFVVHLPVDAKPNPVTIQLADIPFREALRYICAQAGVDFVADPDAIVITAHGDAAPIENGTVLPGASVDSRLSKLVFPEIKIQKATLNVALDLLKKRAADLSAGAVTVNFVAQSRDDPRGNLVTLDTANLPFFAALRYVCYQADAKFAVDKYAIVISPADTRAAPKNDFLFSVPLRQNRRDDASYGAKPAGKSRLNRFPIRSAALGISHGLFYETFTRG